MLSNVTDIIESRSYSGWLCSNSTCLCMVIQNPTSVLSPRIHVALVTY